MKKRLFAGLLALTLCLGVLPMSALAAGPTVKKTASSQPKQTVNNNRLKCNHNHKQIHCEK